MTQNLNTDKRGGEALEIQQQFLRDDSLKLLKKSGLSKAHTVWDLGCGNGTMTEILSKIVGEEGHVTAFDASAEQLNHTRERMKKIGSQNVTFIQGDIQDEKDIPSECADFVYDRYLFMHLQNPKKALQNIKKLLRPGGILVLQEGTHKHFKSPTPLAELERFIEYMRQLGAKRGADYNIGEKMEALAVEAGFHIEGSNYVPFAFPPKIASDLLEIRIDEISPKAVDEGLAIEQETKNWYQMLDKMRSMNENSQIVLGRLYSMIARKI